MSELAEPTIQLGPDWVVVEMPPGFQNRVEEIRRLVTDLEAMGQFGRLLWETGPRLAASVFEAFRALKYDASLIPEPAPHGLAVRIDGHRRLLLHVAEAAEPIHKKSPELAHVFRLLHETAEENDRVVLVTNAEPEKRPVDRTEALTPDATAFLARLGATHVASSTVFALWKLSLQEPDRARAQVERLHAHGGGTWQLPSGAMR